MSHFNAIDVPPEVIHAACGGDMRAHEVIYRACQRPIYSLIRRIVVQPAAADELLQDTFVEILRSIGSYSGQGAFGGWVRAIAVNKCLMHLRSPWRRQVLALEEQSFEQFVDESRALEIQTDMNAQLERALETLPPLTRTVVWLHDVEGYTHGEIARTLGRTVSFSKSQLARAHVRLRQLLDPHQEMNVCTPASTIC